MSGVWGNNIHLSIFGESHGDGIGIVIDGLKPGFLIDMDKIERDMKRRAPGKDKLSTQRKEDDKPEILSGIFNGKTTGAPITMVIKNSDTRSKDYSKIKYLMRPGHGDFPGNIKYKGFNDYRGGGHFSGRITAPIVFAGALAKQILEEKDIFIGSHIKQVGKIKDKSFDFINLNKEIFEALLAKELPVIEDEKIKKIKDEILDVQREGDSIGGIVECGIVGVNPGIGEPFFDSLESTIAQLAFSIPAVKGIEFGIGFEFSNIKGSEANDEYYLENGVVRTYTNNNGGITGGITNGMPVVFRVVIKPTPSIAKEQRTININTLENDTLKINGRHDPCIVQRVLVVIEAITAIAVLELMNK